MDDTEEQLLVNNATSDFMLPGIDIQYTGEDGIETEGDGNEDNRKLHDIIQKYYHVNDSIDKFIDDEKNDIVAKLGKPMESLTDAYLSQYFLFKYLMYLYKNILELQTGDSYDLDNEETQAMFASRINSELENNNTKSFEDLMHIMYPVFDALYKRKNNIQGGRRRTRRRRTRRTRRRRTRRRTAYLRPRRYTK